jgi:putative endonuclease
MNNKTLGNQGEKLTKEYYEAKGLEIISQNFNYYSKGRGRKGEIDVIALDRGKNILHFVEVKTRSSMQFGSPLEQITYSKIQSMKSAIAYFLLKNKQFGNFYPQIDIASVLDDEVSVVFNAISFD